MSEPRAEVIEQEIVAWLEQKVIGLNFCPFARKPWAQGSVSLDIVLASDFEAVVAKLLESIHRLQSRSIDKLETSLLVIGEGYESFPDYLDLLDDLDALIDLNGWRGEFQLASFHPDYQFQGASENARENFTNRSPYPIIHILREESISTARRRYPDTETIPEDNIALLENMPEAEFVEQFLSGKAQKKKR